MASRSTCRAGGRLAGPYVAPARHGADRVQPRGCSVDLADHGWTPGLAPRRWKRGPLPARAHRRASPTDSRCSSRLRRADGAQLRRNARTGRDVATNRPAAGAGAGEHRTGRGAHGAGNCPTGHCSYPAPYYGGHRKRSPGNSRSYEIVPEIDIASDGTALLVGGLYIGGQI